MTVASIKATTVYICMVVLEPDPTHKNSPCVVRGINATTPPGNTAAEYAIIDAYPGIIGAYYSSTGPVLRDRTGYISTPDGDIPQFRTRGLA
jgi:hypothetical protein